MLYTYTETWRQCINSYTLQFSLSGFIIFILPDFWVFVDCSFSIILQNGKYQKTVVFILSLVLLTFTIYCLFRQENKIRVALCLLYYLVFIAFPEEFLCRDVLTYLLKNEKAIIRYCVPNLLFGLSHVFSYSGWEKITVDYLAHFMTSQLLGLFVSGCLFQFMKEKTRTIWIPVLIHGFLDYTSILLYK